MNCPSCGAFNPIGSNYCEKCGGELKETVILVPPVPPVAIAEIKPAVNAGFGERSAAFLLDLVIVSLLDVLLVMSLFGTNALSQDTNNFLLPAVFLLYFWYFGAATGQTPGKIILGIKVVEDNGRPMKLLSGLTRTLSYYIDVMLFFSGFLLAAIRKDKKALHDIIAGTKVVKI